MQVGNDVCEEDNLVGKTKAKLHFCNRQVDEGGQRRVDGRRKARGVALKSCKKNFCTRFFRFLDRNLTYPKSLTPEKRLKVERKTAN